MNRKLGRKIAHRKSLLRNLAASLILYEKIDTTRAKAKEVRSEVEKLISLGKKHDLAAYRRINSYLYDRHAAKKIYYELSLRYENRQSGFVRLFNLGPRLGDDAQISRLELVDRKVFVDNDKKKVQESAVKEKTAPVDKRVIRAEKKLEKLSQTREQSGVVTSVRTKAARKTGV